MKIENLLCQWLTTTTKFNKVDSGEHWFKKVLSSFLKPVYVKLELNIWRRHPILSLQMLLFLSSFWIVKSMVIVWQRVCTRYGWACATAAWCHQPRCSRCSRSCVGTTLLPSSRTERPRRSGRRSRSSSCAPTSTSSWSQATSRGRNRTRTSFCRYFKIAENGYEWLVKLALASYLFEFLCVLIVKVYGKGCRRNICCR